MQRTWVQPLVPHTPKLSCLKKERFIMFVGIRGLKEVVYPSSMLRQHGRVTVLSIRSLILRLCSFYQCWFWLSEFVFVVFIVLGFPFPHLSIFTFLPIRRIIKKRDNESATGCIGSLPRAYAGPYSPIALNATAHRDRVLNKVVKLEFCHPSSVLKRAEQDSGKEGHHVGTHREDSICHLRWERGHKRNQRCWQLDLGILA